MNQSIIFTKQTSLINLSNQLTIIRNLLMIGIIFWWEEKLKVEAEVRFHNSLDDTTAKYVFQMKYWSVSYELLISQTDTWDTFIFSTPIVTIGAYTKCLKSTKPFVKLCYNCHQADHQFQFLKLKLVYDILRSPNRNTKLQL